MRIIGGSARGHPLKTPVGQDIRPTSDKVRLAIFNALFSRGGVIDAVVVDAFCGTGALGLEALSQGAASCHFFDTSRTSLALAKENARTLKMVDKSQFTIKDATRLGARAEDQPPSSLVFIDPPYRKNLITPTLNGLKAGDWLTPDALIVVESEKELPPVTDFGTIDFDKTYGETRVYFIRAENTPA